MQHESPRPKGDSHRTLLRAVWYFAGVALGSLLIWYYKNVDPSTDVMPQCLVRRFTGFSCPGCGSQRFFHALLSGHPLEAVGYNYFMPVALLFLAGCIWLEVTRRSHPHRYNSLMRPSWMYILLALIFVWTIVRNIFGL